MAEHIKFEAWLQEFAKNSKNPFVRNSENKIQDLLELYRSLPSTYGWLKTSDEAFETQAKRARARGCRTGLMLSCGTPMYSNACSAFLPTATTATGSNTEYTVLSSPAVAGPSARSFWGVE